MNKKRKLLMASCLLCAFMVIGGATVACSEKKTETPPQPQAPSTNVGVVKKDFDYPPDIMVEWGEYSSKNIPQAIKGEPYKIFNATANDIYSDELDVTVRVYLHYLEDTKVLMTLKDNYVTPVSYGVYTVEYTATDMFDNVGVYTYEFECKEVETLSVFLSGQQANTLAGLETPIAECTYENAIGNVETKITATQKNGNAVYDLTGKSSFVPMYAGEYIVEYVCTDYNVTVKESYDITVEKNLVPVFLSEAEMQKYFIVGKEYKLPSVAAYQFNTGNPIPLNPVIFVQYGNGMLKQISGYSFKPEREGALKFV